MLPRASRILARPTRRPALVLLLLVAPLLLPLSGAARPMPDGCVEPAPGEIDCAWSATAGPANPSAESPAFPLPPMGWAVTEIRVQFSGPVESYHWMIMDTEAGGEVARSSQRDPVRNATATDVEPATLVVPFDPSRAYHLTVMWMDAVGRTFVLPTSFDLRATFRELVGSVPSGGRAGDRTDPHLRDGVGDSPRPDVDLVAAWFDQPFLDDGLLVAGIALAALPTEATPHFRYALEWRLFGEGYAVEWAYAARGDLPTESRELIWQARLLRGGAVALTLPAIHDPANATLVTQIPLRSIGGPTPEDLFTDLRASANRAPLSGAARETTCAADCPGDVAEGEARPFAIGGPRVWARLRGEGDLAPASAVGPWYAAPFSADSLPNTLQVLGAVAAAATFVLGLLVVRRRRARLNHLLDEIDRAASLADAPAALAALDDLGARIDRLLREGRLPETHHAILAGRVERESDRVARRRQVQA